MKNYDNVIEQLEELGKIAVEGIEDLGMTMDDLAELGYDVELDQSTDWLVLV